MDDEGHVEFMEGDKGLDFIISLLIFMHKTHLKTISKYFVKHFMDSKYVKENSKTPEQRSRTLTLFFSEVDREGKQLIQNSKEGKQKNKSSQQNQPQRNQTQQHPPQGSQPQRIQPHHNHTHRQHTKPKHNQPEGAPIPLMSSPSRPPQPSSSSHFSSVGSQIGQQQAFIPTVSNSYQSQASFSYSYYHQGRFSGGIQKYTSQYYDQYTQPSSRPWPKKERQNERQPQDRCRGKSSRPHQRGRGNTRNQGRSNQSDHNRCPHNRQPPTQPPPSSQTPQHQPGQSQQGSQGQNSAPGAGNLEGRRPKNVTNIKENSNILDLVTVDDLIQGNEACQKLMKLDINFLLNVVLNVIIGLPLEEKHLKAFLDIKDARKTLVHARYDFGQEDFNKILSAFEDAARVLYEDLGLAVEELQNQVTECKENAATGGKALCILDMLAKEAHSTYRPNPTFVPPCLTLSQTNGRRVIEDLSQFIKDRNDSQNLILLSGKHRKEKTELLGHVAVTLRRCSKYKMVLFVNERSRRVSKQLSASREHSDDDSPASLQEQVFSCLTHLAPNTVYMFGLDTAKRVIKECQSDVLFLINWSICRGHVNSELESGTWVFTHEEWKCGIADWKVLEVEPYTQEQVRTMIGRHVNHEERSECFLDFCYKGTLYSLDMIDAFWELCNGVSKRTDIDLAVKYVEKMMKQCGGGDEDIVRLGMTAFSTVCEQGCITDRDDSISEHLWESFLYPVGGEWQFRHSIVRDFVVAKYVATNPSEAFHRLLDDVAAHKRVFKFTCFLWCKCRANNRRSHCREEQCRRSRRCCCSDGRRSSRGDDHLQHVRAFLQKFVRAPEVRQDDRNRRAYRDVFDSWDFLLELDDVCDKEVVECFMSILSAIPCWCFDVDRCQGLEERLERLGRILKKVRVSENKTLSIVMKATTTTKLLTQLWNKMRAVEGFYEGPRVFFELDIGNQIPMHEIDKFLKAVAETEAPLYVRSYRGPFSSCISEYFKSYRMRNLELLKACLCDVPSLQKALECAAKVMHIIVDIEGSSEHDFTPASINLPLDVSLHILMKYSPDSQRLLDVFMESQSVCTLDLYIPHDFLRDPTALSMWSCPLIRLRTQTVRQPLTPGIDRMDVDAGSHGNSEPLSRWLSNLPRPSSGLRVLLRHTNIASRNNLLNSVSRLVVLDAMNSLSGAMNALGLQARDEEEDRQNTRKRRRMSTDEPAATTNAGVEVVIATDAAFCFDCWLFRCECVFRVGRQRQNRTQGSLDDLTERMRRLQIQTYFLRLSGNNPH